MRLTSMDYLCCAACSGELRLTVREGNKTEVTEGNLDCLACARSFEIKEGLPNLLFPETLEESDLRNKMYHDRNADYRPRRSVFKLGIWKLALWETRARRQLINRLELKKNASVLETGVGNGPNLPIIQKLTGKEVQLDGMDISFDTLKVARKKMNAKRIKVELIQGNGSYLPYKSGKFDAVLHVGALNQFGDKKRAFEEMHRVAKPGAKLVICDEGLSPGKEKTWLGRRILKLSPVLFAHKPPVELVPTDIDDLKMYWVWQGTHWVIEFRKKKEK